MPGPPGASRGSAGSAGSTTHDGPGDPGEALTAVRVFRAAAASFLRDVAVWVVTPAGYLSFDCVDGDCCPPAGNPVRPGAAGALAAASAVDGVAVLALRRNGMPALSLLPVDPTSESGYAAPSPVEFDEPIRATADQPLVADAAPTEAEREAEAARHRRAVQKKRGRASVPSWDEIMFGGGKGDVWKYTSTTDTWTQISPVPSSSGDNYFGYSGLAVDRNHPDTIMVGSQVSWWPEGIIWRSTDAGATWTRASGWP